MPELLLHHYPQSPVTEKVRVVLGMKNLQWRSIEIPRLPPKPLLMPLTGGYRRTPVMQIGADVYCDSLCIIRELERRYPEPTIFPQGSADFAWGMSQWIDGPLFSHAITVVLGAATNLPEDFAADRGRLYFGPEFDLQKLQQSVSHSIQQIQGQFNWLENSLTKSEFLSSNHPGLVDALGYYLVWFIRGRWQQGPEFLKQFAKLEQWEQKINAIGHGNFSSLSAERALEIAKDAEPQSDNQVINSFGEGFRSGDEVTVQPEGDGGDPVVVGKLSGLHCDTITISRYSEETGNVNIHFPRVGYVLGLVG